MSKYDVSLRRDNMVGMQWTRVNARTTEATGNSGQTYRIHPGTNKGKNPYDGAVLSVWNQYGTLISCVDCRSVDQAKQIAGQEESMESGDEPPPQIKGDMSSMVPVFQAPHDSSELDYGQDIW